MPTFIKTGFWEKLSKAPKEYLNLDNLIQSIGGGGGSYLKYIASMGQVGISDPQVIVYENTIGNIVWTRDSDGFYLATLAGAFPNGKVWCNVTSGGSYGNITIPIGLTKESYGSDDSLVLRTGYIDATGSEVLVDINSNFGPNVVYEYSIEIRVYP
jgi:hypothetical protein